MVSKEIVPHRQLADFAISLGLSWYFRAIFADARAGIPMLARP
jgi:hypothetical protein